MAWGASETQTDHQRQQRVNYYKGWLAVDASWTTGGVVTFVTPFAMLLAFCAVERLSLGRKIDA